MRASSMSLHSGPDLRREDDRRDSAFLRTTVVLHWACVVAGGGRQQCGRESPTFDQHRSAVGTAFISIGHRVREQARAYGNHCAIAITSTAACSAMNTTGTAISMWLIGR